MSQTINLSVSGIYTSMNDLNGLPPGALNDAVNVESPYKNLLSPRKGFEGLPNFEVPGVTFRRLTNFTIDGVERIVSLGSDGVLRYYDAEVPEQVVVPGDYSSGIEFPDELNGKSRFTRADQNLYLTTKDGVVSLSSGTGAQTLAAGVPKGLNLEAETNSDITGFFNNNVVLSTVGDITTSAATITNLDDTTGVAVGQYVAGIEIPASKVIQDLTYTAEAFGAAGNSVTIAYTTGGTAGAEVVSVVGNAISVQIQSGVSTANQIRTAVMASGAATALVSVAVSGTGSNAQTAPVAPTSLAGGLDNTIPVGTTVSSITPEATIIVQTGNTTATSTTVSSLGSLTGIAVGTLVSGDGIPAGTKVSALPGGGSVTLSVPAFKTATGVTLTFTAPLVVTMSDDALATDTATPVTFYEGAQVAYRMVFGRVEMDANGGSVTRLGAPSAQAIATNVTPYSTNNVVTGTLPKNAENEITFVRLYRSGQTESIEITPLEQYNLVYERELEAADFTARVVTITDNVPDSLVGIPLYTGTDREGILQANNPPPACWDMCAFRDFALYANTVQPSTLRFTIVSVGAPSGIQIDDEITISGEINGTPYSRTYTGKASENASAKEFEVVTSGTPSQNITDTANSLIRVINFDEALPIHAILLSSSTDLPGQILLERDSPGLDTFEATADLHQSAYDPELNALESDVNSGSNIISVSKSGELEAVPATNQLPAGDSSSGILRLVPLRDFVVVIKTDGIYKLQGLTPGGLVCNPFDLTTKIIGADTAVSLNSGVWMLSNQGVVSISDGGVDAKSIPIDDQLNYLIQSYLDNLTDVSFAVGYESERKYILSVPDGDNPYTETQHVFNYVTNTWTKWDRRLRTAFVHSNEGKLYISRADVDQDGASRQRKSGTYRDFVDEAIPVTITSVDSSTVLTLSSTTGVEEGDVLRVSESMFSPITAVDLESNQITVLYPLTWTTGDAEVLQAFECTITWKQVFGDNPAFVHQFSEGLVLFKNTRFSTATMSFTTDFSPSTSETEITGVGNGLWGLFAWGNAPWGGTSFPSNLRFYIPQDKQLGSYLIPTLRIKQGYSDFRLQGLSISHSSVSQEVGK